MKCSIRVRKVKKNLQNTKAVLILRQVRTNPRLSYRELTKKFNENSEKSLFLNTVRNNLLRKNIAVSAAVKKPTLTARDQLTRGIGTYSKTLQHIPRNFFLCYHQKAFPRSKNVKNNFF